MAPGISLLRKSLRSTAPVQFNRDRMSYESKPSTNASTISSLTLPSMGQGPIFHESHGFQGSDVDTVKRSVSRDVTVETETDSVDLKSSLGSSSNSSDLPVRRLSSGGSRGSRVGPKYEKDHANRKCSIQDEILNQEQEEEKEGIDTSVSTSVSSLTLDLPAENLYYKGRAKSFHTTRHVPASRSRSMSRNRRSSGSAAHSLERIREDATTISSCSKFTEEEPASLTLSDLQNTISSAPQRGRGAASVTSDNKSITSRSARKLHLSKLTTGSRRSRSCSIRAPRFRDESSEDLDSSARSTSRRSQRKEQPRRPSNCEQSTSSTDSYVSTQTLELISSLHETNLEKNETISRLEQELSEVANERDAVRSNSDKMMQVMTTQQTELQSQLKRERKGFASMTSVHKKELKEWMDKASSLSSKVLDLEQVARTRDQGDEVRSKKISNLERNVVKLLDMYSSRNSAKSNGVSEHSNFTAASSSTPVDDADIAQSLRAFESMDFEASYWKDKYHQMKKCHDEYVEKSKQQVEELQSEVNQCKDALANLEKENKSIIEKNSDQQAHASDYNDELLSKICQLVDENTLLVERCQELENLKEENDRSVEDLKSKNLELEDALAIEKNACLYLREEVKKSSCEDMHSEAIPDTYHEDVASSGSCLTDLKEANTKLTQELQEKNEAIQAVTTLMDDLKAEQQSIKETVVALRMENLKLRDANTDSGKEKQACPPPGTMTLKEKVELEKRLDRLERENKDLRETNTALSTKLTDETEKTKALQVANEGLASRICKLVAFIKENGKS